MTSKPCSKIEYCQQFSVDFLGARRDTASRSERFHARGEINGPSGTLDRRRDFAPAPPRPTSGRHDRHRAGTRGARGFRQAARRCRRHRRAGRPARARNGRSRCRRYPGDRQRGQRRGDRLGCARRSADRPRQHRSVRPTPCRGLARIRPPDRRDAGRSGETIGHGRVRRHHLRAAQQGGAPCRRLEVSGRAQDVRASA